MDLKDHKVSLLTFTVIFLLLYIPLLGKPLSFEELRLTTYFHSTPTEQVKTFTPELSQGSRFSQHWDQYLKIYPPGLMTFYFVWSRLSFGDEIFLRIPLVILMLLFWRQLYLLLNAWLGRSESALTLLLIGLFPLWYRYGANITPESFHLYLSCLSFCYYYHAITKKDLSLTSLWVINFLGLVTNYFFIFVVLVQVLGALINSKISGRKSFSSVFALFSIIIMTAYLQVPSREYRNPLVFYWEEEVKPQQIKNLFEFSILGKTRR